VNVKKHSTKHVTIIIYISRDVAWLIIGHSPCTCRFQYVEASFCLVVVFESQKSMCRFWLSYQLLLHFGVTEVMVERVGCSEISGRLCRYINCLQIGLDCGRLKWNVVDRNYTHARARAHINITKFVSLTWPKYFRQFQKMKNFNHSLAKDYFFAPTHARFPPSADQ